MIFNIKILALAAILPLVVGFVWYNPKVFGNAWMRETGMTEEKAKNANMLLTFGLTYVLSLLMASLIGMLSIHQNGFWQTLMNYPEVMSQGTELNTYANDFMKRFGNEFRTFKHGALHGALAAFMFAFPVITVNALFEMRSWKYILINAGYWLISCTLMGGIVCAFS